MRIALVSADHGVPCEDFGALGGALAEHGAIVSTPAWDERTPWAEFDGVIAEFVSAASSRRAEFLAWAAATAAVTPIWNPLPLVAWNSDKHYLTELAAHGVATVPTVRTSPGQRWVPPETSEYVVKPAVFCAGKDSARFGRHPVERALAARHAEQLLSQGHTVLTQPYQRGIDACGETSLVYLDGRFSHALTRETALHRGSGPYAGGRFATKVTATIASRAERERADGVVAVISAGFGIPLYARVDLVPGEDARPLLIGCELTRPVLYLRHHAPAASTLAGALLSRLTAKAPYLVG